MFKSMTIEEIMNHSYAENIGIFDELVLFYHKESDEIILNSDNEDYEFYCKLVKSYMKASKERKDTINEKYFTTNITNVTSALDLVIEYRMKNSLNIQAKKMLKIVKEQILFAKALDKIDAFERNDDSLDIYKSYNLFFYGYIQGKRDERIRRKKANAIKDDTCIQQATLKQIITNRIKGINDLESLQEVYNLLIEKDKRLS